VYETPTYVSIKNLTRVSQILKPYYWILTWKFVGFGLFLKNYSTLTWGEEGG
jgi:hypothetical protein